MTQQDGSASSSADSAKNRPRRSRRGWIIAGSIVGVLTLLAGGAAIVEARGGWHHGGPGHMDAEFVADRIEHRVKYVLSEVDATPEQKTQVTAILQATATDVRQLADRHTSVHRQLHDVLSAGTIDRARLEAVRADGLRLADEASQRILQGIADAAEVLSPEQRAALAARMEQRGHWHEHRD